MTEPTAWEVYLAKKLADGWTDITIKGDYQEIQAWMEEHVGDQHPTTSWDDADPYAMWEFVDIDTDEEIYRLLIRHPQQAVLTKLTWG